MQRSILISFIGGAIFGLSAWWTIQSAFPQTTRQQQMEQIEKALRERASPFDRLLNEPKKVANTRFIVGEEHNGVVHGHFEVEIDGAWKPALAENPKPFMPVGN